MSLVIKNAGIVAKPHPKGAPFLRNALAVCEEMGVNTVLGHEAAGVLGRDDGVSRREVAASSDVIIVIGGDGTFLSVAADAVRQGVPIAGFNMGTLGFLTELRTDTLSDSLRKLFTGGMKISERKVLHVDIAGQTHLALNDVVASKGNIARIIQLELGVNGSRIAHIRADGLIIATPTGSTAYSLSAGGPIVHPEVNALVVTPICAHSLTLRPLVVPDRLTLTVKRGSADNQVFVTIDGQRMIPLAPGESFSVGVDAKPLRIIESPEMNYFGLLAEKLNWGFQKCF